MRKRRLLREQSRLRPLPRGNDFPMGASHVFFCCASLEKRMTRPTKQRVNTENCLRTTHLFGSIPQFWSERTRTKKNGNKSDFEPSEKKEGYVRHITTTVHDVAHGCEAERGSPSRGKNSQCSGAVFGTDSLRPLVFKKAGGTKVGQGRTEEERERKRTKTNGPTIHRVSLPVFQSFFFHLRSSSFLRRCTLLSGDHQEKTRKHTTRSFRC